MRSVRLLIPLLLLLATPAWAQMSTPKPAAPSTPAADDDHGTAIFEFGWEGDWAKSEGWHHGLNLACEVTPIENWLELEFGVSFIHATDGTEIPIDLLFKKPWTLGHGVEFMAGVGPELVHQTGTASSTSWGFEAAGDFMIWPSRKVGWYVEPAYERIFQNGGAQGGFGISAGLLIGR